MSTYETTKLELERMMDGGHTVADLVGMIAHICEEKAEFVTSGENGMAPDREYASAYMIAARRLTNCCASLSRNVRIKTYRI